MKKIFLLVFVAIFLNVVSVNAANLICGTGSIRTCPTVGNECSGTNATCDYKNCTCVVTANQTIDSNTTYYFVNLTIPSGVIVTVSTQAGGGAGSASCPSSPGANGPGGAYGGNGGIGGGTPAGAGNYSGGGSGGGTSGGGGGNYSGGGGGGCGYGATAGIAGGAGGGRVNIYANVMNVAGAITANGTVGASLGCGNCGGAAGGGGAGQIFLYANNITITGSINTTGGNGGSSSGGVAGSYGGGGGGGGYIQIRYACSYSIGVLAVNNGNGGTGAGGNGANGINGSITIQKVDGGVVFHYSSLNITLKNQTNGAISGAFVNYYEAGTSSRVCNASTDSNGFMGLGFGEPGNNKIYDVNISTSSYQQNIWYRAARTPGTISVYGNKKWVPETTLSVSKLFTAGHIVPTEIHIFSPYSIYNVGNISLEDWSPTNTSFASNILFEKFNSSGRYTCDASPSNTTYYFIDKTTCTFLNYLNVTADEWLRVTYRINIEGPVAFSSIGQIKNYTLPVAKLRFDVAS